MAEEDKNQQEGENEANKTKIEHIDPLIKRRKDEAVFRLLSDINHNIAATIGGGNGVSNLAKSSVHIDDSSSDDYSTSSSSSSGGDEDSLGIDIGDDKKYEDMIITSTIASAIERGIDKEFYDEILKSAKESSTQIAKICQDHSEPFLESVGKVHQTVGPEAGKLRDEMKTSNELLQRDAGSIMLKKAKMLEEYRSMDVRSRTMLGILQACRRVAVLLEKAKRNAALCRPRYALDAVEEARACLTAPISSLLLVGGTGGGGAVSGRSGMTSSYKAMLTNEIMLSRQKFLNEKNESGSEAGNSRVSNPNSGSLEKNDNITMTLEETPFGARAMEILPKIENEVMMNARRGFTKFILAMRSGGDHGKAGAAALRKCALSTAIGGPAGLGLGGNGRGYEWQALNADNLISRVNQGRVARAARAGYNYTRDCQREVYRLKLIREGMQRKAEAFGAAFGWYRCWDENASLGVEVTDDIASNASNRPKSTKVPSTGRFSLLTRNTASATDSGDSKYPPWAALITPNILFDDALNTKDEEAKLLNMPESVYPILHAQTAYALLGKIHEFHEIYEQNRFSDMKIEGRETRSCLSSLTGDDLYHRPDRIFFAKTLPNLTASVIGFCVVEAALDIGHHTNEVLMEFGFTKTDNPPKLQQLTTTVSRESSLRYERMLITELGNILRERAVNATLTELVRASALIVTLRSTLKIVHPSSPIRKSDRELLSIDVDIIMNALKKTQEEQSKYTSKAVKDERYEPMKKFANIATGPGAGFINQKQKSVSLYGGDDESSFHSSNTGSPSKNIAPEEVVNLPFGLVDFTQIPSIDNINDALDKLSTNPYRKSNFNKAMNSLDAEKQYTFSHSVPHVLRSIHGRAIAFASFCHSQQELGQIFPQKKGGGIASFVLDTVEACIAVTAVAMRGGYEHFDELSVEQAVQIKANLCALQHALPRLFGTLMRGLCHVGLVRAEHLEEAFAYADKTLAGADKSCDKEVGDMSADIFNKCIQDIDMVMNFSLENFQWIAKTFREHPNAYAESLVEIMRNKFKCLGPLDEGSRDGLHHSCCTHIARRLVKLLTERRDTFKWNSDHRGDELQPIEKIDAFAVKNLSLDIECFETFADSTGVRQLKESFSELRCLIFPLIDRELTLLLQPDHAFERQQRYPSLNLEKLSMVLDKYKEVGLGLKMMKSQNKSKTDVLMLERKDILYCLKSIRSQL